VSIISGKQSKAKNINDNKKQRDDRWIVPVRFLVYGYQHISSLRYYGAAWKINRASWIEG